MKFVKILCSIAVIFLCASILLGGEFLERVKSVEKPPIQEKLPQPIATEKISKIKMREQAFDKKLQARKEKAEKLQEKVKKQQEDVKYIGENLELFKRWARGAGPSARRLLFMSQELRDQAEKMLNEIDKERPLSYLERGQSLDAERQAIEAIQDIANEAEETANDALHLSKIENPAIKEILLLYHRILDLLDRILLAPPTPKLAKDFAENDMAIRKKMIQYLEELEQSLDAIIKNTSPKNIDEQITIVSNMRDILQAKLERVKKQSDMEQRATEIEQQIKDLSTLYDQLKKRAEKGKERDVAAMERAAEKEFGPKPEASKEIQAEQPRIEKAPEQEVLPKIGTAEAVSLLANLQAEIDKTQKQLDPKMLALENVNLQVKIINDDIEGLQNNPYKNVWLKTYTEEKNQHLAQQQQLNSEISELENQIKDLNTKMAEAKRYVGPQNIDIYLKSKEVEKNGILVASNNIEINDRESEIKELEYQMKLPAYKSHSSQEKSNDAKKIVDNKEAIKKMQDENAQLQIKNQQLQQEITLIQQRIEQLKAQAPKQLSPVPRRAPPSPTTITQEQLAKTHAEQPLPPRPTEPLPPIPGKRPEELEMQEKKSEPIVPITQQEFSTIVKKNEEKFKNLIDSIPVEPLRIKERVQTNAMNYAIWKNLETKYPEINAIINEQKKLFADMITTQAGKEILEKYIFDNHHDRRSYFPGGDKSSKIPDSSLLLWEEINTSYGLVSLKLTTKNEIDAWYQQQKIKSFEENELKREKAAEERKRQDEVNAPKLINDLRQNITNKKNENNVDWFKKNIKKYNNRLTALRNMHDIVARGEDARMIQGLMDLYEKLRGMYEENSLYVKFENDLSAARLINSLAINHPTIKIPEDLNKLLRSLYSIEKNLNAETIALTDIEKEITTYEQENKKTLSELELELMRIRPDLSKNPYYNPKQY